MNYKDSVIKKQLENTIEKCSITANLSSFISKQSFDEADSSDIEGAFLVIKNELNNIVSDLFDTIDDIESREETAPVKISEIPGKKSFVARCAVCDNVLLGHDEDTGKMRGYMGDYCPYCGQRHNMQDAVKEVETKRKQANIASKTPIKRRKLKLYYMFDESRFEALEVG